MMKRSQDCAGSCARWRTAAGGRAVPIRLEYLLALPLIAGMAGDGELDAAAEWAGTAPEELLLRLGAPLDRSGRARRPDATTLGRALAGCDQGQYDDALCAWSGARARALRGIRRHLRIDGKAVRGAARGGRAPMLLSGIWDDGTTAAQLPVDVRKTNEIPVFRQLLKKVPDLAGTVITADQMHTQRKHARDIDAAGAFFIFTIGENQPRLFDAAGALPWESVAGEAWTAGRVDVRTIKTLPPTPRIAALFPHVRQVFLIERYSYGTNGELLGAVAVLGITSLPAGRPAPLTCWLTCADTGPSRCTITLRDVVFGEDGSRIGGAHRAMAAVRNTVAGMLHLHRVPEHRRPAPRLPPRPLPAPAAVPRPHDTPGTERKPCRDLTTPPARGGNKAPRPANSEKLHDQPKHEQLLSRGAAHPINR